MTVYRGTILDTPQDPFHGGELRGGPDSALLVHDGVVRERGAADALLRDHPDEPVMDLDDGLLLPGFVDTHVHYPQTRAIGGLGLPLLDWLDQRALPEEARLADDGYADAVAVDLVDGLLRAGTTTALVFGPHFTGATEALFTRAAERGLRITTGLVLADRLLPDALLTTPERAHAESLALARAWHGRGRAEYAVTPRFSLSSTDELLAACARVLRDHEGVRLTSHVNENPREIDQVATQFPDARDYTDTYDRHGLLGPGTVLAHDVHPTPAELRRLAETATTIAHCPTSNAALGSGLFPMRAHLDAGVPVALGSDVCAGTGFCLLKEGLQALFVQQLRGDDRQALTPAHLLWLATAAGARALGRDVGELSVGRPFDAVWWRPEAGSTLAVNLRAATDGSDALARLFALGGPADVETTWIGGEPVQARGGTTSGDAGVGA